MTFAAQGRARCHLGWFCLRVLSCSSAPQTRGPELYLLRHIRAPGTTVAQCISCRRVGSWTSSFRRRVHLWWKYLSPLIDQACARSPFRLAVSRFLDRKAPQVIFVCAYVDVCSLWYSFCNTWTTRGCSRCRLECASWGSNVCSSKASNSKQICWSGGRARRASCSIGPDSAPIVSTSGPLVHLCRLAALRCCTCRKVLGRIPGRPSSTSTDSQWP